jgi:hypothetical protein
MASGLGRENFSQRSRGKIGKVETRKEESNSPRSFKMPKGVSLDQSGEQFILITATDTASQNKAGGIFLDDILLSSDLCDGLTVSESLRLDPRGVWEFFPTTSTIQDSSVTEGLG